MLERKKLKSWNHRVPEFFNGYRRTSVLMMFFLLLSCHLVEITKQSFIDEYPPFYRYFFEHIQMLCLYQTVLNSVYSYIPLYNILLIWSWLKLVIFLSIWKDTFARYPSANSKKCKTTIYYEKSLKLTPNFLRIQYSTIILNDKIR